MKTITLEQIIQDKALRIALARESHFWFFHIYFSRYVTYETADFHKVIFSITEDEDILNAIIVAFRGSGKSTIMTLSYPIWAMLGKLQKKYLVILSQTQQQSRKVINNLKQEFETNELLISDFGPFTAQSYEWSLNSLSVPQYKARIDGYSSGESIRGIRHGEYRPQIIIGDDLEDLSSVRTKDSRDKTYSWFTGDILGLGDKSTKTILIGNHLHKDSLIERRKKAIAGDPNSIIKEIPLIDKNGINNWPGKYPTKKALDKEQTRVGDLIAWKREYLLHTVSEFDQVIHDEWIQHYDGTLPAKDRWVKIGIGTDLAISMASSADMTALLTAVACRVDRKPYIYILPNPINKQLTFPETVNYIHAIHKQQGGSSMCTFYIENVAYQQALSQELLRDGINAVGVHVLTDKRSRLALTSHWIQEGRILFSERGCEDLITQITGFGIERYDDLADAFSLVVAKLIEELSGEEFDYAFV